MSVSQIILDPITIMQMTQYFQKNVSSMGGAAFGFIYAQQVQLKFLISFTSPLGTDRQSLEQLIKRGDTYERIRRIKSKTTYSYLLSYDLVGVYMIRRKAEKQKLKLEQLSKEFSKRGFPYSIVVVVDETSLDTKLYKDCVQYPYMMEMQPNQKICIDSFNNQNSKSPVNTLMRKQCSMIRTYNQKINLLLQRLQKNLLNQTELVELTEILDDYDRIKHWNQPNKVKTVEAMNYSILVGLGVMKTLSN